MHFGLESFDKTPIDWLPPVHQPEREEPLRIGVAVTAGARWISGGGNADEVSLDDLEEGLGRECAGEGLAVLVIFAQQCRIFLT